MTIRLLLICETDRARLYQRASGQTLWIPRSVCKSTVKFPAGGELDTKVGNEMHDMHEVNIEDWWWDKNAAE